MVTQEELQDFISGEKFQALCDFEWSPGLDLPSKPGLLYVCGDHIGLELWEKLTHSNQKFVLLSHNSDVNMTQHMADSLPANVIRWFSQNMNAVGDRVQGIPIGLANSKWPHGNITDFPDPTFRQCLGHCYWCCKIDTNPGVRHRWFEKAEELQSNLNVTMDQWPVPRKRCLEMYSKHLMSLSPPGNGLDCHRHYEILLAGGVPVIEVSDAMTWVEDLPVVWIGNEEGLTSENLEVFYNSLVSSIQNGSFKPKTEVLTFSYWKNLIEASRSEL